MEVLNYNRFITSVSLLEEVSDGLYNVSTYFSTQ